MTTIKLTKWEVQLLRVIAFENIMLDIATQLFISYHKVDFHRKSIQQKFKVRNTAGLIRKAFELGLLHVECTSRHDTSQVMPNAQVTLAKCILLLNH